MIRIDYPAPVFRLRDTGSKEQLFDPFRKKWVPLTPEEWVRQNFLQYLLQVLHYPASLIAVEKELKLGELKKRFDILVYDAQHRPWMLVECKAMDVSLDESVLQQLLRYHISIPVPYLVITNGKQCYAWNKTAGALTTITELPSPIPH